MLWYFGYQRKVGRPVNSINWQLLRVSLVIPAVDFYQKDQPVICVFKSDEFKQFTQ